MQPEKILDKRVFRKTRGQEYFQYLIKWKDKPEEDATWMTEGMLQKIGRSMEELMDRSHEEDCPQESDAEALDTSQQCRNFVHMLWPGGFENS